MSETTPIKSENKIIKLQEDEYQLEMTLYNNNNIEFKITLNSPMATCYYIEKYNFETIKEISYLYHRKYNDMETVFQYYKEKIFPKQMNLVLSSDKNIMSLKYQKVVDDEMIDVELKLKKIISKKEDIIQGLMKEVEQLKKKEKYYEKKIDELTLFMEEYNKIKEKEKEEEKKKIEEVKKEENIKIEEEKFSSLNDNVNLINNFKFENFRELKYIDGISGVSCDKKSVAVYCIIKNNERLYQMAYCKNKVNSENYKTAHIIIYNLVLNKIENKIYNAHKYGNIDYLKHYFDSSTKNHILLSSCSNHKNKFYEIKLWNISSNPIMKILKIKDCRWSCLLFKNEEFFIFGEKYEKYGNYNSYGYFYMSVWNKNGNYIKKINKINCNNQTCYISFIEATYFENKNYILISGNDYDEQTENSFYSSKCYNYDEDDIKTYKCDENNYQIFCINLFKKGNDIYLITGSYEKINIFEFETTNLIKRIQLGEKSVNSLCSINEKYIIASNSLKIKIIDMEKYSVVKEYSEYFDDEEYDIMGIEKIKIPEKGEFIITYSKYSIKILKI